MVQLTVLLTAERLHPLPAAVFCAPQFATVMVTAEDVPTVPAALYAFDRTVCMPFEAEVVSHG